MSGAGVLCGSDSRHRQLGQRAGRRAAAGERGRSWWAIGQHLGHPANSACDLLVLRYGRRARAPASAPRHRHLRAGSRSRIFSASRSHAIATTRSAASRPYDRHGIIRVITTEAPPGWLASGTDLAHTWPSRLTSKAVPSFPWLLLGAWWLIFERSACKRCIRSLPGDDSAPAGLTEPTVSRTAKCVGSITTRPTWALR